MCVYACMWVFACMPVCGLRACLCVRVFVCAQVDNQHTDSSVIDTPRQTKYLLWHQAPWNSTRPDAAGRQKANKMPILWSQPLTDPLCHPPPFPVGSYTSQNIWLIPESFIPWISPVKMITYCTVSWLLFLMC